MNKSKLIHNLHEILSERFEKTDSVSINKLSKEYI